LFQVETRAIYCYNKIIFKIKGEVLVKQIKITTEFIKLDQLMKFADMVDSGGEAKMLIAQGLVLVNGEICTQRGKKIRPGDEVEFDGQNYQII
jgi:ribosome-associated protein